MNKLILLIRSGRPITAFTAYMVSLMVVLKYGDFMLFSIMRVIPMFSVTLAGFIINDYFDYEKDKLADIERPITVGNISRRYALIGFIVIAAFTLLAEAMFAEMLSFGVILMTLFGVVLYTPFAHRVPLGKGLFTSLLTCAPILYAQVIASVSIPNYVYLIIILYVFGREVLLDIRDCGTDISYGLKTIPSYIGESYSIILGWFCMFLAIGILSLFVKSLLSILFAILSLVICVNAFISYKKDTNKSYLLTRIIFLTATVSVIL